MSSIDQSLETLGSVAGRQAYTPFQGKDTYSRILDDRVSLAFCTQDLRTRISPDGWSTRSETYQRIGREYSWPWGGISTHMQGGGYFKTLETSNDESRRYLSSHQYALEKVGEPLEEVTGLPMEKIQQRCDSYGIQYFVNRFFDGALKPEEGDLVVYYDDEDKAVHSGIFRDSQPNWNSPDGGTVESKWDRGILGNPFVFQHDFFFLPKHCGDTAKFYRVKKVAELSKVPPNHNESNEPMYIPMDDGTLRYISNEANERIRATIDKHRGSDLVAALPQIECVADIDFYGVCSMYALDKIFNGDYQTLIKGSLELLGPRKSELLENHFTITPHPQVGDLAVYSHSRTGSRTHFGVYVADDLIESKWGKAPVYRHPPFYVDTTYGDTITYYRLNPEPIL